MARAYKKKPVTVEAVQWTGENHAEMCEFIDPEVFEIIPREGLVIHTLEGDHHASPGDYIIKGVNGEFYPCKPDIFAKTYESAALTPPNDPLTLEQITAERDAAQAALAERAGLTNGYVQTLFGVPLERMRELAQAELEGRIVLRSAGSGKKCGSCVHWHRISETKRGTCDVRQWERNRRGHMEPWRHSFTPAQSYGACRYYIPGEDSANG